MDAFAVSMVVGTTSYLARYRAKIRLSFHFGLFQFLMPILGWFAGLEIATLIAAFDHWIAFSLLLFLGLRMIHRAIYHKEEQPKDDPTRGISLIVLSLATSIDALAVGFSLGLLRLRILYPSVVIGIVAATMSLLGIYFGRTLSTKFGKNMEIVGGVILILIGVNILISHLQVF